MVEVLEVQERRSNPAFSVCPPNPILPNGTVVVIMNRKMINAYCELINWVSEDFDREDPTDRALVSLRDQLQRHV